MKTNEEIVLDIQNAIEGIKTDSKALNAALAADIKANGETAANALKKADELATKVSEAAASIIEMEQKLADRVVSGKAAAKTLADVVLQSEQFKNYASGATNKMSITVQNNTITGQEGSPAENSDTLVPAQRLPGIVPGAFRNLTIRDFIQTIPTNSNSVEYTKESLFTNNAAETDEGAQKPESVLQFQLVQDNIRTIAHFIKASKQILMDAPQLEAYINTRMRYGVDLKTERQLIAGTGASNTVKGMLASGNYTAFTPVTGENQLDSLNRMQEAVVLADYAATGYIMHPADWHAIERLKVSGSDDRYIIGNPVGVIGRVLWGLPVLVSNSMTQGQAICADFGIAYGIYDRMSTTVEMFEQDEDNAQLNLVTIRAENRVQLGAFRPASSRVGNLVA